MTELPHIALITGGSRGIGRAISLALAEDGFDIALTYKSRADEAESAVSEIRAKGRQAWAYCVDSADSGQVSSFFAEKIKGNFFLSVLVNNAGITRDGLIMRMKDEDFDAVLDTNLRGAFLFLREASKIMMKQRYGRIINIASVVGLMGNAGQVNYASAKAGLIGMTKSAARELGPRSVTVNAVAPGFIETDMTSHLGDDVKAGYITTIPLGRMGRPRDVADAVSFLASEKASYITGQVISVNGGMYC